MPPILHLYLRACVCESASETTGAVSKMARAVMAPLDPITKCD